MSMERHIPQDLEAEEALLGAMLLSEFGIEQAGAANVDGGMLLRPSHRLVFESILRMRRRDHVDELTVIADLRERGKLVEAGGASGVMALAEKCPAVANAKAYALAVKNSWVRREAVTLGEGIAALGYDDTTDPAILRERAAALLDGFSRRVQGANGGAVVSTMRDQALAFYDAMTERYERGGLIAGLSTGIKALDERWGGLQPGRLYVIAGRPGMGKTALGMGIAESVAFGSGANVLSFNFEMSPVEQGGRAIARHGSLNLHRLANTVPTAGEFEAAYEAITAISEGAQLVAIDESPSLTIGEVCSRTRDHARMLEGDGRKLGVVLVDYVQKVKASGGGEKEYDTVTRAVGDLKALALELGVPVIALAQLNRGAEHRAAREPSLADLRGSGAIEQDADVVALLHRPEYYGDESPEWRGRAVVATAKNRVGADGADDLSWEGSHVRYSDWRGPVFHVGGVS